MCDVKWHLFKFFNDLFTCKTCVVKIWLFDFCEVLARVSGKRQCAKCGQALKIVLKNVRWQKNKKHRVGLCVGYLFLSIFLFSVLSQWFTFQFIGVSVFFLHLAVTFCGFAKVAIFTTKLQSKHLILINHKTVIRSTASPLLQNRCWQLVFCRPSL